MPASTLYDLAKTRLIQNINMLDDIGDLPYHFLAPILKHLQNPSQLLDLEARCPQLMGETGEIWLRFIRRDVPEWDKKPHQPRDPKSWGKVYKKLMKDVEREKKEQEDQLKEKMRALQQNKAGNQTTIIEGRLPASAMRRPSGWGSGGGGGGGGGSSRWGTPGAPAKTGKMAFDKLRRSMFDQKRERPKATQMPNHLLQQRRAIVQKAPERMIRTAGPSHLAAGRGNAVERPGVSASAPTPQKSRPSLPAGQHFAAPKIRSQPVGPPAGQKRKREEPNLFMQKKR